MADENAWREIEEPQRDRARQRAEGIRGHLEQMRHVAPRYACDALRDALVSLELVAERSPDPDSRMWARQGIFDLATFFEEPADEYYGMPSPTGVGHDMDADEFLRSLTGSTETTAPQASPLVIPAAAEAPGGRVDIEQDRLPRRGRNAYIGCHCPDGSSTWIHGRPHTCPKWAR